MPTDAGSGGEVSILQRKRDATRYQVLTQIAERQPAVNQREIGDALGITSQAVSEYVRDLVEKGFAEKHGRGRYEVTKEGVDWLISQTETLREFVEHVTEDVIGQVDIESAIATADIDAGQAVSLTMQDGMLHAMPGAAEAATAVAVTNASAGGDIGVSDFEGIVEYDFGRVTIVPLPPVQEGGSRAIDADWIRGAVESHSILATAGTEARVAIRDAGLEADIVFGAPAAVEEAAMKGLDVLVLAASAELSGITERLRDATISYEVIETNSRA